MITAKYLVVRAFEDDREVKRIDVTGKGGRAIETIERGLLRQMDTEKFYVVEEVEGQLGT
jgi:hypothetical protein